MASLSEEIDADSSNTNKNVHNLDVDMIDVVTREDSEPNLNNKSLNIQLVDEEASPEDSHETSDPTILKETTHVDSESKSDETSKPKHLTRLPMSRIKYIMKTDEDCSIISQDAIFLVTKATEMFIELIAKEIMKFTTSSAGKRKLVSKKEVDSVIDSVPYLCFLDGIFE